MRAIARGDDLAHLVMQTDRLHGAHRFIVDRNGPGFLHRGQVAFDQQDRHPHAAQKIRQCQARRAGTDNDHIRVKPVERHGFLPCISDAGGRNGPPAAGLSVLQLDAVRQQADAVELDLEHIAGLHVARRLAPVADRASWQA